MSMYQVVQSGGLFESVHRVRHILVQLDEETLDFDEVARLVNGLYSLVTSSMR
jgi:hypothetical protein